MYKIAHLSDLHLGPLPRLGLQDLSFKRCLGYLNWHLRRNRFSRRDLFLERIIKEIQEYNPDHICITGDIVNFALQSEFNSARIFLEKIGPEHKVAYVPGNHDAYAKDTLSKATSALRGFVHGDSIANNSPETQHFPYLRLHEDLAIIGLSSAALSLPFMSSGVFGYEQAYRLSLMLKELGDQEKFRIILIHHPPLRLTRPGSNLFGASRLKALLQKYGAELVLHGHTHKFSINLLNGVHGRKIPLIGVASAAPSKTSTGEVCAGWNIIEIARVCNNWRINLEERVLLNGQPSVKGGFCLF